MSVFWESLEGYNTLQVEEFITLDRFDIMLGKLNLKENKIVINFVIMHGKWLIMLGKLNLK